MTLLDEIYAGRQAVLNRLRAQLKPDQPIPPLILRCSRPAHDEILAELQGMAYLNAPWGTQHTLNDVYGMRIELMPQGQFHIAPEVPRPDHPQQELF